MRLASYVKLRKARRKERLSPSLAGWEAQDWIKSRRVERAGGAGLVSPSQGKGGSVQEGPRRASRKPGGQRG